MPRLLALNHQVTLIYLCHGYWLVPVIVGNTDEGVMNGVWVVVVITCRLGSHFGLRQHLSFGSCS
jgi:hypothetical protein